MQWFYITLLYHTNFRVIYMYVIPTFSNNWYVLLYFTCNWVYHLNVSIKIHLYVPFNNTLVNSSVVTLFACGRPNILKKRSVNAPSPNRFPHLKPTEYRRHTHSREHPEPSIHADLLQSLGRLNDASSVWYTAYLKHPDPSKSARAATYYRISVVFVSVSSIVVVRQWKRVMIFLKYPIQRVDPSDLEFKWRKLWDHILVTAHRRTPFGSIANKYGLL